jgi:cystathionine gamma-synthase
VRYPGFGAIVSIVVRGGADAADAAVSRSQLWLHATSLGGVESTWERRRRWAAEHHTIPDGLIRLSVGLEHVDDLYADLVHALS